jgi:hypothetical protein
VAKLSRLIELSYQNFSFFPFQLISDSQPLPWALKCDGGDNNHFKGEKPGEVDPLEYAAQIGHLPSVQHLVEKCDHNKQLGGSLHQVGQLQHFLRPHIVSSRI